MSIKIEDDNVLHLSGGRKIENEDGTGFMERKFDYRMTLGDNVDKDKFAASEEAIIPCHQDYKWRKSYAAQR
ncbi:MAG: hypothetical protein SGARI_001999 [Bacillariaceae sp.]